MANTSINWTDKVWNPARGCSKVSPGCANCYAERMAGRFGGPGLPYEGLVRYRSRCSGLLYDKRNSAGTSKAEWTGHARFVPEMLTAPLHWKQPCRVFVNSMSDLFHDDITNEQIAAVFGVMAACQQHTFQVLTKRPRRMVEWFGWAKNADKVGGFADATCIHAAERSSAIRRAISPVFPGWPLSNVHLGVSVENQPTAEERIHLLLKCPASVHWISGEPLLSGLDIRKHLKPTLVANSGERLQHPDPRVPSTGGTWEFGLDWVVCGGESGPNARPPHPDWVRSLRDQCRDAGVPFHFKQWGEWLEQSDGSRCIAMDGRDLPNIEPNGHNGNGTVRIARIGKAKAGNLLDGERYEMRPGDKWQ